MNWKQFLIKLAWRAGFVANVVASYIIVRFAADDIRNTNYEVMGGLVGKEVLILWALVEIIIILVAMVVYHARKVADRVRRGETGQGVQTPQKAAVVDQADQVADEGSAQASSVGGQ